MNKRKDEIIYAQKGQSKIERKNFKAAVVDYSRAIRLRTPHIQSIDGMGDALLKQEKYKEARLFFKRVVLVKPKYAVAYYNLALVLDKLGKTNESLEMYKESIRLDPTDADGYINLAILLSSRERYEEARECYLKMVELEPSDAFLFANGIGCLYFAEGILTKAKEKFEESVSLDGNFVHAKCNMGLVLFCEGKSEEALKYFEDGIKTMEDESTVKEITANYRDLRTRFEVKLKKSSDDIVSEEQRTIFKMMIDGLTKMINLLTQHLDQEK